MKGFRKAGTVLLVFILAASFLFSCPVMAYDSAAEIQTRDTVNGYISAAKAAYYSTDSSKMNTIRTNLTSALALVPYRTDLYHIIANTYAGSASSASKIMSAYDSILNINPKDTKALFYMAYWNHFLINNNSATFGTASTESDTVEPYITRLKEVDPGLAAKLADFLTHVQNTFSNPVTDVLTQEEIDNYNNKGNTVIITLGNALQSDGSFSNIMIGRLNKTIEIANQIPSTKIIVSGGVPKAGTNEGVEMKKYLINNGIAEDRIITENHSRNTSDNIIYSGHLADNNGAEDVILISSNTHVRRSSICLKAFATLKGCSFGIKTISYMETNSYNPTENSGFNISMIYSNAASGFNNFSILFQ